jgi:hypothetical protein
LQQRFACIFTTMSDSAAKKFSKAVRKGLTDLLVAAYGTTMTTTGQFRRLFLSEMKKNNYAADNLLFWSMHRPDDATMMSGSRKAAESMAKANGLVTLSMLYPDRDTVVGKIENFGAGIINEEQREQEVLKLLNKHWKRASRAFARIATGTARVILAGSPTDGTDWPNPNDFFVLYEWAILIGADTKYPGNGVTEIYRYEKVQDVDPKSIEAPAYFGQYALIWSKAKGVIPKDKIKLLKSKRSSTSDEGGTAPPSGTKPASPKPGPGTVDPRPEKGVQTEDEEEDPDEDNDE